MKKLLLILICLFVSFEVQSEIKEGDIYSCVTINEIIIKNHKIKKYDTRKFNIFVHSKRLVIISPEREDVYKKKLIFQNNFVQFTNDFGFDIVMLDSKLDGTKIINVHQSVMSPGGVIVTTGKCVLEE